MPITHTDGQSYFSQAELEAAVKDRLKNVGEKVTSAESLAADWERKYKEVAPKVATADTLAAELETWKQKAASAEGGLVRYQASATHGVTDADTIEALENAHAKAMRGVAKDKQTDFGGYLAAAKADPTILPSYLRGVFGQAPAAPGAKGADAAPTKGSDAAPATQSPSRPAWAPATAGQQPVATGGTPSFSDRVAGAKSLDDLVKIQQERVAARRG